jgi:DNA-binding NarL/FixJ family response regulator
VTPPHPPSRPAARILIVDDHAIFREGVKLLLQRDPQLQVIAEAANAEDALALTAKEQPDIVLLDVDLAGFDALDIIEPLRTAARGSLVILLTGLRGAQLQTRALRLGARGFVPKEHSADFLIGAIRRVRDGELWFDRGTIGTAVTSLLGNQSDKQAAMAFLTRRELEIVRLIGEGMRNDQIAKNLAISEKTVRNHLTVIFEKAGVRDRLHLAIYAYRHGLAKLPR